MKKNGFSLLEILIALIIVGILSCIIYPNYNSYVVRMHRNNAKISLLNLATVLEGYHQEQNTYVGADFEKLKIIEYVDSNFYRLKFDSLLESHYKISAVPVGKQAKVDSDCGILNLDSAGNKGISGINSVGVCW